MSSRARRHKTRARLRTPGAPRSRAPERRVPRRKAAPSASAPKPAPSASVSENDGRSERLDRFPARAEPAAPELDAGAEPRAERDTRRERGRAPVAPSAAPSAELPCPPLRAGAPRTSRRRRSLRACPCVLPTNRSLRFACRAEGGRPRSARLRRRACSTRAAPGAKGSDVKVQRKGNVAVVVVGQTPVVQLVAEDAKAAGDASLDVHAAERRVRHPRRDRERAEACSDREIGVFDFAARLPRARRVLPAAEGGRVRGPRASLDRGARRARARRARSPHRGGEPRNGEEHGARRLERRQVDRVGRGRLPLARLRALAVRSDARATRSG